MRTKLTIADITEIAAEYCPISQINSIVKVHSGNVNDTFIVHINHTCHIKSFVLQRINTDIFQSPEKIIKNYLFMLDHIHNKGLTSSISNVYKNFIFPKILFTLNGTLPFFIRDNSFWRATEYISTPRGFTTSINLTIANNIGEILSYFHSLVQDLPLDRLYLVMPNFHDLSYSLNQLDLSINKLDNSCKLHNCPIIDLILEQIAKLRPDMTILETARQTGELQLSPIHGDPKIDNILIDKFTLKPVALIDFDTFMPGLPHYDFGDCLRSICNLSGENTRKIHSVYFDINILESFLKGYFKYNLPNLSKQDFYYLPYSLRVITFELGVRFLTDHIDGDVYFHSSYLNQNLFRSAVQFKLLTSIDSQWNSISTLFNRFNPYL